jgi:hypothetical protein
MARLAEGAEAAIAANRAPGRKTPSRLPNDRWQPNIFVAMVSFGRLVPWAARLAPMARPEGNQRETFPFENSPASRHLLGVREILKQSL